MKSNTEFEAANQGKYGGNADLASSPALALIEFGAASLRVAERGKNAIEAGWNSAPRRDVSRFGAGRLSLTFCGARPGFEPNCQSDGKNVSNLIRH